jgi:nucleotide-binding universal stress UspA family protein
MRRHDDADVFIPPTHAGAGGGGQSFQRICVPVGPSGQGDRTLALAARFCAATGGRLRVVHVRMWDPAVRGGGGRFYLETSEEATAVLDRALSSVWACGVAASGVIVDAPRQRLARAIAAQARAWRAEVLVVARRPRTALGALLFGGLPERLMREAGCPVLVLRQPRK